MRILSRLGALVLLLVGGATATAATATAPAYVDARLYPTAAGWERFLAVERALVRGFDNICGDTFCEGEYHNLRALRLRCSVHAGSGAVASCHWTFVGSNAGAAADDGRIQADMRNYDCRLPLAPGTPLEQVLAALEGAGPDDVLDIPLPGMPRGTYGVLVDCL
ncbi:MAG: hypothetical protein GAK31_02159 [Stenotrophomonas maltophilia]|uniref:Secreted protein n=1 Tax=Stenotrophomonas maltophilia TaxID=40324 RepID=A0A7V8JLC8_STEMA|nr:MAG: hypothetical protein GAK31_02159 [Stenotrophomonas maltophilia]